MSRKLLTDVVVNLVNRYATSQEYGVSLVNIPDFNYADFVSRLYGEKSIEVFFLGFSAEIERDLTDKLPTMENVKYSFSVEDAETSRNTGNESIFRVLIIKRAELEKISSLRWFPEISLEKVYTQSCDYVKKELKDTNSVIEALIQALRCKPVRSLLSFERVLDYLELLLSASADMLPDMVRKNYYKLGLLADKNIVSKNPNKNDFVSRIKRNHVIIERISNLEQAERQSITNYYAKTSNNKDIPRLILSYYKTKNIELLKKMDIEDVESCLKAVKEKPNGENPPKARKTPIVQPTALAAQLVFEGNTDRIDDILDHIKQDVDERSNTKKSERVEIDYDSSKIQIKAEPLTEKVADQLTTDDDMGGIIHADVDSPDEAIKELEKYEFVPFKKSYLDDIRNDLKRISALLADGEQISEYLDKFLQARDAVAPYRKRLQDAPMLQVLARYTEFEEYIRAYERLLVVINEDFPKIWGVAASNAKAIINAVMSLDYVFVVGESKLHAMPTPLHPLYLWKYVELAREILSGRGVSEIEEECLSDDDKSFIIRKAEDIPDPLSVMLLPATVTEQVAAFLPLAGRIGLLPIYSNVSQVNQSESGMDTLKQAIVRYICLYPHAGMMLRMCFIDPPSVEVIVSMLKALNADKEFNISGIEVTIFRTKEVPGSWIEIDNDSLNEGMLGKYKGRRSLNFNLKIVNKRRSYNQILSEISTEQHLLVVFDPNEVKIETAQNSRQIHIHPLCVPKIYKYNPISEEVEIRPASEGGIFTIYSSIIEKLNEHPSTFSHTSTFFRTPLKRDTYESLLKKSDWLVILDQSLKSWDISLRAASEKLFYRENDYRSVGIYSANCNKFVLGYDTLVKQLGNFIPKDSGIKSVIESIRNINDDGLLSIVSHTSNKIFDEKHGKGSLGTAIAAIHYKRENPDAILVGLDTQLAQEWLSDREEGELPDLVAINLHNDRTATVDIVEVKTYANNPNAFEIKNNKILGHAVQQVTVLERLIIEMFGATERITTVSRREILREQVFECLFHTNIESADKMRCCDDLNALFAGEFKVSVKKNIAFVDFNDYASSVVVYEGGEGFEGNHYTVTTIGSNEIQSILADAAYTGSMTENPDQDVTETAADASATSTNPTAEPATMTPPEPDNMAEVETRERKEIDAEVLENGTNSQKSIEPELVEVDPEAQKRIEEKCAKLNKVLKDYGIRAESIEVEKIQEAARFTRFPVKLKSGETVNSLNRYKNDIGIQLEANGEILIEHIKGTSYISVDVPFADSGKSISLMEHLDLLNTSKGRLDVIAGQTPDGKFEILDVAGAPHMLIAGTTGSGKTIFLQSILVSLLYQFTADEMELLIVDPKQTDFIFFEGLPHLYGGKVIIDAEEALEMLQKINAVDKEERTAALRACRSKDIDSYNQKNSDKKMKRLVVVIDEYSDLIQAAELKGIRKDFENNLLMLLQRVRNLGIHLIIATQRPSAQIVTGQLKAVIPFRVSFRLPSHTDSQTILDMSGAENLLGKGDMLMVTESDTKRMQGLFVSETELEKFLEAKIK
ncbi:MAG: hypothetical protein LUG45_04670 [Clostridiales bacterium]|nr:hypothetical protein [Clostridiales bacterium]